MTTGTVSDDVRAYLDRVRGRLDDLPAEEREDLLADVEPSVLESAEDSEAPIAQRLGPPERFADELRAAAGLPPRAPAAEPATPRPSLRARVAAHPLVRRSRGPAKELAPLWWAVRGGVAAVLLTLPFGPAGAALVAVAVVGAVVSLVIGLRRLPRTPAGVAVNVLLALAALPVAVFVLDQVRDAATVVAYAEPVLPGGLSLDGQPLDNVYAYDRKGRLLYDVRLFDAAGRPLDIGGAGNPDPARRVPRTRTGTPAFNAFPIRYFDPGTTTVANPSAGSPLAPEPLAGAPLVRDRETPARAERPKRRARGG